MAAFLGFWLVLLSIWKKRQKNSSYADE